MSMSQAERRDLAQLVRKREKLAKADVDRVAAERLADFEQQAASEYRLGDDEVWKEQMRIVQQAVADAQFRVAERCRSLGIPEWTAPQISDVGWYRRGENAVKERVAELRKVAQTRVAAQAKAAKVEIERSSIGVQEQLVVAGLESEEARRFLEAMPTPEQLMPAVTVREIEAESPSTGRDLPLVD